jgi:D-amino-acid dehydrogenase
MAAKTIIIGAGVIGAATAMALQKHGHEITLIDRDEPCAGASFGNAGGIVNGSCAPLAMPGALFDGIRNVLKSDSPLSIHPAYLHKITPWLVRFLRQSKASVVNKNARHLHALSQHAVASWLQLVKGSELESLFRATGWLKVYETQKTFDRARKSRELLTEMGAPYELLNTAQIHDLEPSLAPIFKYGLLQSDSLSIINPARLVRGMVKKFVASGGIYKQFNAQQITVRDNGIELTGLGENLLADTVVIAAGAWSRHLASQLGDTIPLDTERGYHLMLGQSTDRLLNRPVLNEENSFVLCPMETGLRMTAQVEFAGLDIAPNFKKIRNLIPVAQRMLPGLNMREESAWMGFRPSLPDSLPVLGTSSQSNHVFYAFGHQHLGMTLAAITGQIIADLVTGKEPPIAISPYRANRFTTLGPMP